MIFLKKLKAQCHWNMFIEKEFIIHIEFRKAKEWKGMLKRVWFMTSTFGELYLQEYNSVLNFETDFS